MTRTSTRTTGAAWTASAFLVAGLRVGTASGATSRGDASGGAPGSPVREDR